MLQKIDLKYFLPVIGLLHCLALLSQSSNPLFFIENKGQWGDDVLYAIDIPEGKLFLKREGLKYQLNDMEFDESSQIADHHSHSARSGKRLKLEVNFADFNEQLSIVPCEVKATNYNFYYGSDPDKWAPNCKAFSQIIYKDVYEGIDLKIYANGNSIKYDWIVAQNQDPQKIKLRYSENAKVYKENGCAFIDLKSATLMEDRPVSFQMGEDGNQYPVTSSYQLNGNELSFEMGTEYDPSRRLIIDPELVFSTFSGSVSDNFGYTACFDDKGNLYSGGIVFGSQFPNTTGQGFGGGVTDMAILKYDSTGENLLYATFIGGSDGESPHSLIVNNDEELLIMGTTGSQNFPTSTNAYDTSFNGGTLFSIWEPYPNGSDIVLTKLDQNGQIVASTFIGSSGNDGILKMNTVGDYVNKLIYNYGDYQRGDIIVDELDNIYVASVTDSTDFPMVSPIQGNYAGGNSDAVIFSLNSDLSQLRWSTYLGGSDDDAAYSIKLNSEGKTVIGGGTASDDFPTTNDVINSNFSGDIDGFISILDAENSTLAQSTFLGTIDYDQAYFIDIDQDQFIYAMGQTTGLYPVTGGVYSNANSGQFIHKLSSDLSQTEFSTVFGSGTRRPNISPTAFLANECDKLFLSGWGGEVNTRNTSSDLGDTFGMEVTPGAFSTTTDGSDFYLMVLSADGSKLLYATYFGSTNNGGDHVDGGTSRFDKRGIIYQSVCTCGGSTDNFPTTENAWSRVNRGVNSGGVERCNNAAFKFDLATIQASFKTKDANDIIDVTSGCVPLELSFINESIGGEEFSWDFGNGETSNLEDGETITYDQVGQYTVSLIIRDINTCIAEDMYSITIDVFEEQTAVSPDMTICVGSSIQLAAEGGENYRWLPEEGLDNPFISSPLASPSETTLYEVKIATPGGCIKTESIEVAVVSSFGEATSVSPDVTICEGSSAQLNASGGESYRWFPQDGLDNPSISSPIATPSVTTQYEVEIGTPMGCTETKSVVVAVAPTIIEDFEVNRIFKECNELPSFEFINRTNYNGDISWNFGDGESSQVNNPIHTYTEPGSYSVNLEINEDCVVEKTVEVESQEFFVPNVITPNGDDKNEFFEVRSAFNFSLTILDRKGVEVFQSDNYLNNWNADGLPAGIYYYDIKSPEYFDGCKGWLQVIR